MNTKICAKCKKDKTEEEYSKSQFEKRSAQCKACKAKYTLERKNTIKITDVVIKVCSICKLEKDIIKFGQDAYTPDGFNQRCKECQNKNNKEFKQSVKNKNLQGFEIDIVEKICSKCNIKKDILQFGKDIYSLDGFQLHCKVCNLERGKRDREKYKEINLNKEINIKSKVCTKCNFEKDIDQFSRNNCSSTGLPSWCKLCTSQYHEIYHADIKQINLNKTGIDIENKICSMCKLEKDISQFGKHSYTSDGFFTYCKPCYSQYQSVNKETTNKRKRERRKEDPVFRFKSVFRRRMSHALSYRKLSKNNRSTLDMVEYSLQQLMNHIETKFEFWMHWKNQGTYNPKTWNDNDPSTWKWQLDHIIPESEFTYTSIEDQEFKECWALKNLRPYSAKQNIIDGAQRIRHKKKRKNAKT